mmetsp:Transcript_32031/g.38794  ORF Transcript_32031/g.38794 Transcript_32031/m.38794 type:complete len:86 (+) Transcript_32031:209-466(+)
MGDVIDSRRELNGIKDSSKEKSNDVYKRVYQMGIRDIEELGKQTLGLTVHETGTGMLLKKLKEQDEYEVHGQYKHQLACIRRCCA